MKSPHLTYETGPDNCAQSNHMADAVGVAIVDDSAQWIDRLGSVVAEIPGLVVLGTAGSPSGALELVSQLHPPIMILDMGLSGGSGVEVLRKVGSRSADIRVVVLTGYPSVPLRELCMNLGARYFLDKAFEFEQLTDALRVLKEELVPETGKST